MSAASKAKKDEPEKHNRQEGCDLAPDEHAQGLSLELRNNLEDLIERVLELGEDAGCNKKQNDTPNDRGNRV